MLINRFYYQRSPDRVATCPITIHVLLHIAGGIKTMGPVWAYWVFPMERFCGKLLCCIKSWRHPFANIDSYITAVAQLDQIKNCYNAHERLQYFAVPPRVHMDSSGLHQNITVFGKDCLWYVFRVRVRVPLKFGFRFGCRFRFKVLKGHCSCVCRFRVRD
jgi:hypothetical protein